MYLNNFFKIIGNYDFKKINIFFLVLLFFLHFMAYFKYELNLFNLIKYFFFHIIYILIPGLYFYNIYFKSNHNNNYKKFAYAFGFGIFLITIEYFVLQYFQKLDYIIYINVILSLIFLIAFFFKKPNLIIKFKIINILSSVNFFTILFLTNLFLFGSILSSPPLLVSEVASYNQDKLYSVGIMEGLLRNFPPPDVKVANEVLNYHGYFVFIYLSLVSFISGIPNFEVYFYLSQYFKIIFFILSLSYFSNFVFKKKKESNIFIFISIFFGCSSLFFNLFSNAGKFHNENLFSISIFPSGYMQALAYMFIISPEIIKSVKYKSFSFKHLLLFIFFLTMIFGNKAPNAAFMVGAINLFFIFLLISKVKISSQFFSLVIVTNILFFIFYFLIYFNAQANYGLEFHIGQLFRPHKVNLDFLEVIVYNFVSLFFIPFHQILFHPFSVLITYSYVIYYLANKKNKTNNFTFIKNFLLNTINLNQNKNYQELFIFSATLISLTSYIFWFQYGGSTWFMMIGTFFFSIFSLKILFKENLNFSKYIKNFLFILILISILSTIFSTLRHLAKGTLIFLNTFEVKTDCEDISYKNKTKLNKFNKYYSRNNCPDWDRLTKNEYLGLMWIKKNTSENSIILSDRLYYSSLNTKYNARYFYYSIFSERIFYLEGFYYWVNEDIAKKRKNLIEKFYNNKTTIDNKKNLLKKEKIDFVIVSNFLNNDLNLNDNYFKLVFKNRDIKIYKIQKD